MNPQLKEDIKEALIIAASGALAVFIAVGMVEAKAALTDQCRVYANEATDIWFGQRPADYSTQLSHDVAIRKRMMMMRGEDWDPIEVYDLYHSLCKPPEV